MPFTETAEEVLIAIKGFVESLDLPDGWLVATVAVEPDGRSGIVGNVPIAEMRNVFAYAADPAQTGPCTCVPLPKGS